MTNISPRFVLKQVLFGAAISLIVGGCAKSDGSREKELGKGAYELRDLKKAEKMFEAGMECAPDDLDMMLYLARVKLDLGDRIAAQRIIDRALQFSEGDVDVEMFAAQLAWHAEDYAAALERFGKIANDAKLSPELRSQGWAGIGLTEMTCDHHHLARIAFLRAIRIDRHNAAAWYHLGLLYRDGFGYVEAALEQFEIFVRLEVNANPRVQKVQRTIIPALKEMVARAAAERPGVSKRNSSLSAAEIAKADADWKKNSFKTARQHYQAALSADPLSYPAAIGLAKAWLKTDATKAGQQKAFDSYKTACVLRPSAVSTYLTTGALAMKLGLYAQSVEIYSRAVASSPASKDAIDGLIRSLNKVGGKGAIAHAYQEYRDTLPRRK